MPATTKIIDPKKRFWAVLVMNTADDPHYLDRQGDIRLASRHETYDEEYNCAAAEAQARPSLDVYVLKAEASFTREVRVQVLED